MFQLPGCSGAWLGSNYSPEPAASFVHLYSLGHNANLRNPFAGVQCSEFRVYLSQDKNRQKSNGAAAGLHDGEDKVQVPTTEGGDTLARNELGGSGRIPRSRINTPVAFTVTPCWIFGTYGLMVGLFMFRARDVVHPLHLVYCLPLGEHGNFGEGAPQAGSSTHQDLEDSFPLQPTPYRLQEGVQRVIKLVVNKHIVWAMSSLLECGSD